MDNQNQLPSLPDADITPASQEEADSLRFSGLGNVINPGASLTYENVAQTAYDSARRLLEINTLKHNVDHDDLTGLLTKKALLANANQRLAEAQPDQIFALLFIDLDNFKAVNDKHPGKHAAGDQVLKDVATLLMKDTRQTEQFYDLLAHGDRADNESSRLGGDEFAIFVELTGRTESSSAMSAQERLDAFRGRLETDFGIYMLEHPELTALGFGMSAGGVIHQPGQTAEDMLIQGDQLLTAEKAAHHALNGQYRSA